jgi:drug/metabolite transporter (DMT)-like permease
VLTAVALALLAALLFGVGTALQAHASTTAAGSLAATTRRPVWLLGIGLDALGALSHIAALRFGPLALVQPVALTAVVAATAAAALLERRPVGRRRLRAALETAAGLGLVAACLGHGLHPGSLSARSAVVATLAAGLAVVVPGLVSRRSRRPTVQAVLLGMAAGASCGLSAAFVRAVQVAHVTQVLDPVRLLGVLAAAATGALGLVLTQAAFARGRVTASLPAQDLLALVVSIGAGAGLAGEVPAVGPWSLIGTGLALLLVAHGGHELAREPGSPARRGAAVAPAAAAQRTPPAMVGSSTGAGSLPGDANTNRR